MTLQLNPMLFFLRKSPNKTIKKIPELISKRQKGEFAHLKKPHGEKGIKNIRKQWKFALVSFLNFLTFWDGHKNAHNFC